MMQSNKTRCSKHLTCATSDQDTVMEADSRDYARLPTAISAIAISLDLNPAMTPSAVTVVGMIKIDGVVAGAGFSGWVADIGSLASLCSRPNVWLAA